MKIQDLTEQGCRDLLMGINALRDPIRVRLQDAQHQAALYESAAESLGKVQAFMDMFAEMIRGRLGEILQGKDK